MRCNIVETVGMNTSESCDSAAGSSLIAFANRKTMAKKANIAQYGITETASSSALE